MLYAKKTKTNLYSVLQILNASQIDVGAGYKTLATSLVEFSDPGCLPVQIDLSRLDEGGKGIQETSPKIILAGIEVAINVSIVPKLKEQRNVL